MKSIEEFLKSTLHESGRSVILGVGSVLMADDAAGVMITDTLCERFGENVGDRVFIVSGGNAPECLTGVIKAIEPDTVLIIDAADIKGSPGDCIDIHPSVVCGVSFSTHMLPLKVMLEYLQKEVGCKTVILGIQPESLEFAGDMTPQVRETVDELIQTLQGLLEELK